MPAAQDASLFGWLRVLYPIWARLTPQMLRVSTQMAMAELLLSGCTTSSDHLYLFPNGSRLDDCIEGAAEIGMRFHAARGGMSIGESQGGLPPDSLVEDEAEILKDSQRLVEGFPRPRAPRDAAHRPGALLAVLGQRRADARRRRPRARIRGELAHAPGRERRRRGLWPERFGRTPAQYAEELGWLGPDVWHAHCVKLDDHGVACSAGRGPAWRTAPAPTCAWAPASRRSAGCARRGWAVGIGVDGSASNDGGHVLAELRQAMLLQRVAGGAGAMSGREALEIGTIGGAASWGATTSAPSRRAWPPTWPCST